MLFLFRFCAVQLLANRCCHGRSFVPICNSAFVTDEYSMVTAIVRVLLYASTQEVSGKGKSGNSTPRTDVPEMAAMHSN